MTESDLPDEFSALFAADKPHATGSLAHPAASWKVLLVDDAQDIHAVLKLALQDIQVEGRSLLLLDADSATQAKTLLAEHCDTALVLLDVVMENDRAGLDLVEFIRQSPEHRMMQIILLTGQPGYAPQREVITGYDINGYVLKSDLSDSKIFTEVYAALRTYRTLSTLEYQRQQLEQQSEKLRMAAMVFSHAREGIMITDAAGTIIEVNQAFSLITGYSSEEAIGNNARMLSAGRHDFAFFNDMWQSLLQKGHWRGEIWNRRRNGEVYAEMLTISSICDDLGGVQQFVALFSDITGLKEHEQDLERIAYHDALTGLPNRILLADRLTQGMIHADRYGLSLVVAYLDLDGFKKINDSYGHEAGDQVLIAVASRMQHCLRETDTLARLGGDEFVIVLPNLTDSRSINPLLTRLLSVAAESVALGQEMVQVSASMGVAIYPQAKEMDGHQLLKQADQAMYQAKLAGKNRYHYFGDP